MTEVRRLRESRIEWKTVTPELFCVRFEDETILLRLNEFPYESLCTVILNGREVDLEVFPDSWSIVS